MFNEIATHCTNKSINFHIMYTKIRSHTYNPSTIFETKHHNALKLIRSLKTGAKTKAEYSILRVNKSLALTVPSLSLSPP